MKVLRGELCEVAGDPDTMPVWLARLYRLADPALAEPPQDGEFAGGSLCQFEADANARLRSIAAGENLPIEDEAGF